MIIVETQKDRNKTKISRNTIIIIYERNQIYPDDNIFIYYTIYTRLLYKLFFM